jgi:hypothetical protein
MIYLQKWGQKWGIQRKYCFDWGRERVDFMQFGFRVGDSLSSQRKQGTEI